MTRSARTILSALGGVLLGGFAPTVLAMGKEVPKQPLEGQLRAPCQKGQKELNGGCWAEVTQASGACWFYLNAVDGRCYAPLHPAAQKK